MADDTVKLGFTTMGSIPATSSSALRYPRHADIGSDSDYVSFEFFKYQPPFKDTGEGKQGTYARYNDSADFLGANVGSIIMYMPEDIQAEYGANWGGAGFGLVARQLLKGAALNVNLDELFNTAFQGAKKGIIDSIVQNANKALGSGVTTNQAVGGIEGKVVNPNVEMMYESPEMRGFSLNFKMNPVNQTEATEVRKICNTFKKNMLPEFGNGAFISVPNVVRVTFMSGSKPNKYVSQFKPCAITNVSINYTPDGSWASYKGDSEENDGSPVSTQLTIQFKELKMIFADDIKVDGETY